MLALRGGVAVSAVPDEHPAICTRMEQRLDQVGTVLSAPNAHGARLPTFGRREHTAGGQRLGTPRMTCRTGVRRWSCLSYSARPSYPSMNERRGTMHTDQHDRKYHGADGDLVARLHFMIEHGRAEHAAALLAEAAPVEVLRAALERRAAQLAEGNTRGTA